MKADVRLLGKVRAQVAALSLLLSGIATASAEPVINQAAPPLTITTWDGKTFDLDAMRGRVVLVNFWATWCAPCLAEMPTLSKFYRAHHAEGFDIIALSTDFPKDREKMRRVLARLPYSGALLSEASRNGYGTPDGVPVSYVVDAKGVVRDKFIAVDAELLDDVVSPLLNEIKTRPRKESR